MPSTLTSVSALSVTAQEGDKWAGLSYSVFERIIADSGAKIYLDFPRTSHKKGAIVGCTFAGLWCPSAALASERLTRLLEPPLDDFAGSKHFESREKARACGR